MEENILLETVGDLKEKVLLLNSFISLISYAFESDNLNTDALFPSAFYISELSSDVLNSVNALYSNFYKD